MNAKMVEHANKWVCVTSNQDMIIKLINMGWRGHGPWQVSTKSVSLAKEAIDQFEFEIVDEESHVVHGSPPARILQSYVSSCVNCLVSQKRSRGSLSHDDIANRFAKQESIQDIILAFRQASMCLTPVNERRLAPGISMKHESFMAVAAVLEILVGKKLSAD